MISKLLWVFERGIQAVRTHTKFLLVIVLLFVFPFLYLQLQSKVTQTALQNVKTADTTTVNILHESLQQQLANGFTIDELLDSAKYLTELSLYVVEEGRYTLATTTDPGAEMTPDFMLNTAPNNGDVFIFADETPEHRLWTAVSKQTTGDTTYLLATTHDYSAIDSVIKDRQQSIYTGLAVGFLFLFLIAYWLLRQTNWEARYKDLERRLNEEDMLITSITHEFRTPLTAIKGYASFLAESNRLRPRDRESLSNIQLSTERLIHLVNDFLEVAKIQSGKLPFTITKVHVSEVVAKVVLALRETAAEKRLYVRDGTNNTALTFPTDAARLEQVITNLVSNAIKYSKHGGVTLTYEKTASSVRLRIQDTGSGITAEDQKKLFMPFSRVGGVEKTVIVGSGLGMWISKRLVENLGGAIEVESISGVGTHVVIVFDLRKIAALVQEESEKGG